MSGTGVDGLPELVARLDRARAGVLDLTEANRAIAQLVDRQASADAPRATGALAGSSSITAAADGWGITYNKPYAVPVHFGTRYMTARPWLTDAAHRTEDSWMDQLTEHVQQLLD